MSEKTIKNLFIDANVWLSLFHFSNDDLEQFRNLQTLIGTDIILYIPEQISHEVYRNRENRIKDALDKFEKFSLQFPAFSKSYPEYETFAKDYGSLKTRHKEWLQKLKTDIVEQTLSADIVIREFFTSIDFIPTTDDIIQRAVIRYNIGNPPGKDNKYGDAINWEALLAAVPEGEDLFFISNDNDYSSVLDVKRFHPFLMDEWMQKKKSNIIYFKSLVEFLNEHFADIKLKAEQQKEMLIKNLSMSGSFVATHKYISQLSKYTDWSVQQVEELCSAAVENSQVYRIFDDDDVFAFYQNLLNSGTGKKCSGETVAAVRAMIAEVISQKNESEDDSWLF
jgi:hypothetical protein